MKKLFIIFLLGCSTTTRVVTPPPVVSHDSIVIWPDTRPYPVWIDSSKYFFDHMIIVTEYVYPEPLWFNEDTIMYHISDSEWRHYNIPDTTFINDSTIVITPYPTN